VSAARTSPTSAEESRRSPGPDPGCPTGGGRCPAPRKAARTGPAPRRPAGPPPPRWSAPGPPPPGEERSPCAGTEPCARGTTSPARSPAPAGRRSPGSPRSPPGTAVPPPAGGHRQDHSVSATWMARTTRGQPAGAGTVVRRVPGGVDRCRRRLARSRVAPREGRSGAAPAARARPPAPPSTSGLLTCPPRTRDRRPPTAADPGGPARAWRRDVRPGRPGRERAHLRTARGSPTSGPGAPPGSESACCPG
jgi:hypothetical protein